MSKPTPTAGSLKLIRPAAIELRFSNKPQYKRHVRFYLKALGSTKPFNPPKGAKPYTHADSSFSFQVGMIPKGWKDPDLQLRFVLLDKKQVGKNRTVIYWKVEKDDFAAVVDSFGKPSSKLNYRVLEQLHPSTPSASPDSASALLSLPDTATDTSAQSLANKNDIGNSVGLVINPPYPRIIDTDKSNPRQGEGFLAHPIFLGLLGLVVGLVVGWVVSRLTR